MQLGKCLNLGNGCIEPDDRSSRRLAEEMWGCTQRVPNGSFREGGDFQHAPV